MPSKKTTPTKSGATIKAVAEAKFIRKGVIKEAIPGDVTRARASAWLDLISPFTEWAGLKGDKLRYVREQLRLQSGLQIEETLLKIAENFKQKQRLCQGQQGPILNKFLIPFLEKSSLEHPESSLVELWSNLLVSASEQIESYHIHFITILSQISQKQAVIFRDIIESENLHQLEVWTEEVNLFYQHGRIERFLKDQYNKDISKLERDVSDEEFNGFVNDQMAVPCLSIVHGAFENIVSKDYYDILFGYRYYEDEDEVDYSILESVGLIRKVETDWFKVGQRNLALYYYYVTTLGLYFARACKMLPD